MKLAIKKKYSKIPPIPTGIDQLVPVKSQSFTLNCLCEMEFPKRQGLPIKGDGDVLALALLYSLDPHNSAIVRGVQLTKDVSNGGFDLHKNN